MKTSKEERIRQRANEAGNAFVNAIMDPDVLHRADTRSLKILEALCDLVKGRIEMELNRMEHHESVNKEISSAD